MRLLLLLALGAAAQAATFADVQRALDALAADVAQQASEIAAAAATTTGERGGASGNGRRLAAAGSSSSVQVAGDVQFGADAWLRSGSADGVLRAVTPELTVEGALATTQGALLGGDLAADALDFAGSLSLGGDVAVDGASGDVTGVGALTASGAVTVTGDLALTGTLSAWSVQANDTTLEGSLLMPWGGPGASSGVATAHNSGLSWYTDEASLASGGLRSQILTSSHAVSTDTMPFAVVVSACDTGFIESNSMSVTAASQFTMWFINKGGAACTSAWVVNILLVQ